MKRIGILTYHRAHNYGAVLQCYALERKLEQLGYDVSVIDYHPKYIRYSLFTWYNWLSLNPIKTIKKTSFQLCVLKKTLTRRKAFNRFINNYLRIEENCLNETVQKYDCFVLGSDQIWRKTKNCFDPIYWGDFKAAKQSKIISYAASMGNVQLSESDKYNIKGWLNNFSAINVRETSLRETLIPLTEKEINITVDPTFLLQDSEWNEIAKSPDLKEEYILIYQVIPHSATYQLANEVARKTGAKIIEIASHITKDSNPNLIMTASPEEFIGWIKNAKLVITTSFHGTAFSLIYRTPFVCIKQHKHSDLRMESILGDLNLIDRFIDCNKPSWNELFLGKPKVDDKLFIKRSLDILTKSIHKWQKQQ